MLELEPNEDKLLKDKGDLYALKQDFPNAIKTYENLVERCPAFEYKLTLSNLYMAEQDFVCAEKILEPMYNSNPNNPAVINAYLNDLLAQQKTTLAYKVITGNHLEETKEGFIVLGDMAMQDGCHDTAINKYYNASLLDPENLVIKNKLAKAYRSSGCINNSAQTYLQILAQDSDNLQAKIGLGHLEIDKKNYEQSRKIFCEILAEKPDYKPAQKGIVQSYLANGDSLKALEILNKMPADADIKLMKAKIYYDLDMHSDAFKNIPNKSECESCTPEKFKKNGQKRSLGNLKNLKITFAESKIKILTEILQSKTERNSKRLKAVADETIPKPILENKLNEKPEMHEITEDKAEMDTETFWASPNQSNLYTIPSLPSYNVPTILEPPTKLKASVYENAQELKYKIRRHEAITLTPTYSFMFQQLADEFDLDYHKFGMHLSKAVEGNKHVFMEYNVIVYTSGNIPAFGTRLNNLVNEFRGGIQARPVEKWEYRADMGVKAFEFDHGAMITADSWLKHYFNDKFNLKIGYRRNNIEQSFLSAVGEPVNGIFTGRAADNKVYVEFEGKLPRGFYTFGRGGYGIIYAQNLPTNQYSEGMVGIGKLLYNNPKNKWINIFGIDLISSNSSYQYNLLNIYDNKGRLFGGYFSPSYFNANTLNLKLEGNIEKWHLNYGIKAFGGIQTAISPDSTAPAWGFSPYIAYNLNDNVCINLAYNHFNYASVQRDQFIINAVIRGFRSHGKN